MADMNGTKIAEPVVPLRVVAVDRWTKREEVRITFNRSPSDGEIEQMRSLPPSPRVAQDLGDMVKRAMTFEIVVRLCRAYILSPVLRSEGPEVVKFLRNYIDGAEGIGPLGAPLPWPDAMLETAVMLREWGFERSPNGWVARAGTQRPPPGVKPS